MMKILDLIFGKKKKKIEPRSIKNVGHSDSSYVFTKSDLCKIITTLTDVSYAFRDSITLNQAGGNRSFKMMTTIHSYAGMFCYLYESWGYGISSDLLDSTMSERYILVKLSMDNIKQRENIITSLSNNWSDVLCTIETISQGKRSDGYKFDNMSSDIEFITKSIEKWSGRNCKRPKKVKYNPYFITEGQSMSEGHSIPDLSSLYAKELLPLLLSEYNNEVSKAEITREYVLTILQSYLDNAEFVPMNIVETLCSQIEHVAKSADVSFGAFSNLKDYILDKIYK